MDCLQSSVCSLGTVTPKDSSELLDFVMFFGRFEDRFINYDDFWWMMMFGRVFTTPNVQSVAQMYLNQINVPVGSIDFIVQWVVLL